MNRALRLHAWPRGRALAVLAALAALAAAPAPAQAVWTRLDGPAFGGVAALLGGFAECDWVRDRLVVAERGGGVFEQDGARWLDRGLGGGTVLLVRDQRAGRIVRGVLDGGELRLEWWDGAVRTPLAPPLRNVSSVGPAAVDWTTGHLLVLVDDAASWNAYEWDGATWSPPGRAPYGGGLTTLGMVHDVLQARTLVLASVITGRGALLAWNGSVFVPVASTAPLLAVVDAWWNPVTARIGFAGTVGTVTAHSVGVFEWDGVDFAQVAPLPPGIVPVAACCDRRGRVHLVGAPLDDGFGSTWLLENGQWRRTGAGHAAERATGCTTFVPALGATLATGGSPGTSTFDGAAWSWNAQAPLPARVDAACALGPGGDVVLFGGGSTSGAYSVLADCHVWNGSLWVSRSGGPPGRSHHAMQLDTARGRVVLCGGIAGMLPDRFLRDAWEWDGASWTRVADLPQEVARHAIAFDAARGRIVVHGGIGPAGLRTTTLEWDGTSWLQPLPVQQPPAGSVGMAFDPGRAACVLVTSNRTVASTWLWDGTAWIPANVATPPAGTLPPSLLAPRPQLVFDARRHLVLYHDGVGMHALTDVPATVAAFGVGCARTMALVAAAPARPGGVLRLDVVGGSAVALTAFAIGTSRGAVPLGGGCTLLVPQVVSSRFAVSNAFGFASAAVAIPATPALRGAAVAVQAGCFDASAPLGVALSHGLTVVVGD